MSEQSKRLAAKFEYSKENHPIHMATALRRDQILNEAFARMCAELTEHLETRCEELNHEPQIENILQPKLGDDPIGVRRKDSGAFLSIKFDSTLHKVTFKCDEPAQFKYVVEVKPTFNGSDWWYADKDGSSIAGHLEYVAQKVLSALLGIDS
jgi:hypothetical protein